MAEDNNNKDAMKLEHIKDMIRLKFEPVQHEAEADLLLTSDEIIGRIVEYNGLEIDKDSLTIMLNECGYKCIPDSQMHFVWLFKEN